MCAGKAVMYLYRHPREHKDNKARAGRIIHTWARPIFHKTDNLASMTKEDRRMKDAAVAARHTQMMSAASAAASRKRRLEEAEADAKRPGEAGWVGRARVPQVSCDWWRAGHVTTVLTSDWSGRRRLGTTCPGPSGRPRWTSARPGRRRSVACCTKWPCHYEKYTYLI